MSWRALAALLFLVACSDRPDPSTTDRGTEGLFFHDRSQPFEWRPILDRASGLASDRLREQARPADAMNGSEGKPPADRAPGDHPTLADKWPGGPCYFSWTEWSCGAGTGGDCVASCNSGQLLIVCSSICTCARGTASRVCGATVGTACARCQSAFKAGCCSF